MSDEELIARLRELDGWVMLGAHTHLAAADRIEALIAELATCEKYRDAYAECDRIGTQAVRDLEAKLAKAVEALGLIVVDNTWGLEHKTYMKCRTTLAAVSETHKIKGESHE